MSLEMEKLIELLNEYENYLDTTDRDDIDVHFRHINWAEVRCFHNYSLIISKRYLFIKWLVENDKIELHELSKKELSTWWSLENNILDEEDTKENWIKYWTENLLMLLAISDTPIDDLISYLK